METTPILSTAYLPPIDYMSVIAKNSEVLIEAHETYPKQTYRNRCVIDTAAGALALNVHVSKPGGNHTKTCEVALSYDERWNVIHWRAIESAYNSAPYFLYYRDQIERLLLTHYPTLLQLNDALLKEIMRLLKIYTTISYTTEYKHGDSYANDLRDTIHPKKESIVKQFDAYSQVFETRHPFISNLTVLDLVFNLGPESKQYLLNL